MTDLATLIGTVVGSIAASFGATWYTIVRPMKRLTASEQPDQPAQQKQQASLPPREDYRPRFERIESDIERLLDSQRELSEAVAKRLTTEEFQAYTTFTTSALHQLTEKVGEVRGQLMSLAKGGR